MVHDRDIAYMCRPAKFVNDFFLKIILTVRYFADEMIIKNKWNVIERADQHIAADRQFFFLTGDGFALFDLVSDFLSNDGDCTSTKMV